MSTYMAAKDFEYVFMHALFLSIIYSTEPSVPLLAKKEDTQCIIKNGSTANTQAVETTPDYRQKQSPWTCNCKCF